MKLILAPYLVPLLLFFPMVLIILSKPIFTTKASLTYLGNKFRVVTELILQASELSFFSCIHFWLFYIFKEHLKCSAVLLNVYFLTLYLILFVLQLYDYQNGNFNMQMVLFSTLKTYVPFFHPKRPFSFPLDLIPRNQYNSLGFLSDVANAIIDEPIFWFFFILFFLPFFAYCIYIIVKYKIEIFISSKKSNSNNDFKCNYSFLIENKFQDYAKEHPAFNNKCFKIIHILGLLYITVALSYLVTPVRQRLVNFTSFTTFFNIVFSFSHFEKKLNENINLLNITRKFLPKGRYWLDNRDDPIYPFVHGDINAFCAYNNNDEKCQNRTQTEATKSTKIKKIPNIYFMIMESFTPFSYLINNEFIDEHSLMHPSDKKYYYTNTAYYNERVLPNLAKYSKEGIVFSGLAANGLPTMSGLHSLFNGVLPSQSMLNVVDSVDIHTDDFPSHFHDIDNFRTFYVTPSDFEYEGLQYWLNRRTDVEEAKIRLHCNDSSDLFDDPIQQKLMKMKPVLKNCSKDEINNLIKKKRIKSFPKWFDYLANFFPDENQSKFMNITEPVLKSSEWIADRILSKEIELIWKQQRNFLKRKNIEKPILGVTINMETHIPYFGLDNPDQYEKTEFDSNRFSQKHKKQRFIRVNKYADKYYIGEMLDFLKREDNNTIVIVLGDHGTRDIPARSIFNKGKVRLTKSTKLSGDCYGNPSGIDSLFVTSGAIFYLGDDQDIKKELKLDLLKGKTIKVATDHNDIIYTIMDLISRFQNKPLPPTHRLGRNLIDFSEEIINTVESGADGPKKLVQKLNNDSWQSLSYISYQTEYKRGAEFLRTHSAGPKGAHYYNVASFPTCVKRIENNDMALGGKNATRMFNEMSDYLDANNYLLYHNRIFNYDFRNETCIHKGSCSLPPRLNDIHINDGKFLIVLFGIPLIVGFLFYVIIHIVRKLYFIYFQRNQNQNEKAENIEI